MSGEWVFLLEAYDDTEADIIMGFLESHGIPSKKKYKGPYSGLKVIMGKELGVSILVPPDMEGRSRELLESISDS